MRRIGIKQSDFCGLMEETDEMAKGGKLPVGTMRVWGGVSYIKEAPGKWARQKSGNEKNTEEQRREENARKAKEAAETLFPNEKWVELGNSLYCSQTRLNQSQKSKNEQDKFVREKEQAAILTSAIGSTVFFLPEINEQRKGVLNADCVIDGEVVDLKKSGGNLKTIAKDFRKGIKQAKSVFFWITSPVTPRQLYSKLAGEVVHKENKETLNGRVIVYFENNQEGDKLHFWRIADMIKKQRP